MSTSWRRGFAVSLAALALAGCVETGDFGRVKKSVWNDAVATTGTLAAMARREPVSGYDLTDDETDLRGRAWRFLEPAHERAYVERLIAELVATRLVPAAMFAPDDTAYHRALLDGELRSPASRYRRLSEDVMADVRLIDPFARVASRVLGADAVRRRALGYVHDLTADEIANAEARVAENRCLIAWVTGALGNRVRAYRFSIEHLLIETPQADAVPVERALASLWRERGVLDGLGIGPLEAAACAGADAPPVARAVTAPPPRGAPLVRKG